MYCQDCGQRIDGSSRFCSNCGAKLAFKGGKNRKSLLFALGGVGVIALILIVILVTSTSSPEKVAEKFVNALNSSDIAQVLDLIDPEILAKEAKHWGTSVAEYKKMLIEELYVYEDIDVVFVGRIAVDNINGNTAVVSVEWFDDSGYPEVEKLPMIKRGTKWYVNLDPPG